jgi:Ca2+-dependent lipid-binding protein
MGADRNFPSNPYCVLRLGGTSIKTSTVKNSTNPDWPDEDAAYFIVHNREQELQAQLGWISRWNLW